MKSLFFVYLCVLFAFAADNDSSSSIAIDDNNTVSTISDVDFAPDSSLGDFDGGASLPPSGFDVSEAANDPKNDVSSGAKTGNTEINNKVSAVDSPVSADEKLKDDIITFDRIGYIKDGLKIGDPFIYIYPETQEDIDNYVQAEKAVLVLNGIFEDKASINNVWVRKDDVVEGWTVSNVKKDRVELRFRDRSKVLYVYTNGNSVQIK